MHIFNKAITFIGVMAVFCFVWFGVICSWIMTQQSDLFAAIGTGGYIIGALAVIYGTIATWKKEAKLLLSKIKEGLE